MKYNIIILTIILIPLLNLIEARANNSPYPMLGHDLQHTGRSPYQGPSMPLKKWKLIFLGYLHSSPAIGTDGTIYIGITGDYAGLSAIDIYGVEKWCFRPEFYYYRPSSMNSSPAIGTDGTIYIGSDNKNLYAINPDGTEKWEFLTQGEIRSSPTIGSDGTIYVGSNDKKLYAINPDGTEKWEFGTGKEIEYSSPAIGTDNTIYIGSDKLYAVNSNGTKKWDFTTLGNIKSSPAIEMDGTIYVNSDYKLYAISPDGSMKWEFNPDEYLFELLWSSPAIGTDSTIYIGSNERFYAINPDGTKKWELGIGLKKISPPTNSVIGGDGVIYINTNGKLYAINPDGTKKWEYDGESFSSSFAIGRDGTIYIPLYDSDSWYGQLCAIGNIEVSPVSGTVGTAITIKGVDFTPKEQITIDFGTILTIATTMVKDDGSISLTFTVDSQPAGRLPIIIKESSTNKKKVGCYFILGYPLADRPWPKGQYDLQNTSRSSYSAPSLPKKKWEFPTGAPISTSPVVANDGTIYVASDNKLYAVKPDGTKGWEFIIEGRICTTPAISADKMIYIAGYGKDASYLYALKPDGTEKWRAYLAIEFNSTDSLSIGANGTVYIGSGHFSFDFRAYNQDGSIKWRFPYCGETVLRPAIGTDGTIYIGAMQLYDALYAINADGIQKWRFSMEFGVENPPSIGPDGTIYVSDAFSDNNKFYAINPDGSKKWEFAFGTPTSSPAIDEDGTIYVGALDHKLYAINSDGTKKWEFVTGDKLTCSPSIGGDGTIYVSSWDKNLYAINPNGTKKWEFPFSSRPTSPPVIGADGTIYIGCEDGKLYAITSEDSLPPGTITDLATTTVTFNSVGLTWTAVGDDGYEGTATLYEIRYSTSTITEVNWNLATLAGTMTARPAYSQENFLVTNLLPSTTYYFRIKVKDDADNWSALSNQVTATTLPSPVITFISPTHSPVGRIVTIAGNNFYSTETIRISFGQTVTITVATAVNGSWTTTFTVDDQTPGTITIIAYGLNSKYPVITYFLVTGIEYFVIDNIPSPQIAGQGFSIKITACDKYGETVMNFKGTATLSDTSGTILPTVTSNFTAGIWQGTVTITKAGTTAITASCLLPPASSLSGTSNPFYVQPGAPTKFIVYPQNSVNIPAGGSVSITAQLTDTYDNPVGSAGITCDVAIMVITGTAGILSTTTTTTNSAGQIATITYFVSTVAGDQSKIKLIPHPPSLIPTTSGTITTIPGTLTHFVFDPIATQTAGVDFQITVTAKDQYENTVSSFQGTTTLSDLTNSLNPRQTSAYVAGIWTGMGSITVAGTTNITAGYDSPLKKGVRGLYSPLLEKEKNNPLTPFIKGEYPLPHFSKEEYIGMSNPFVVKGGTITSFEILSIATQTAGVGFGITVVAKDRWANIADGFTGTATLTLTLTPNPKSLTPTTTTNFTAGVWQSTVTITKADTTAITASCFLPPASSISGTSNSFTVLPASLDHFVIATITNQTAGIPFTIIITAKDSYGNTAAGFTGTANLTLTPNPESLTPTTTTNFTAGIWKGTVTIIHVGTTTITATAGTKTGTSNAFAVIPSELTYLVITPATGTLTVNSTVGFTASGYDAFWNEIKLVGGRWEVTPVIGTFTNLEGPATTFIAGTKATTGIVTFATNSISGTANISILPGALHRLNIIPPAATISVMGSQPFESRGEDKHGNRVEASVNWQVSGGVGTVTPSIGSYTLWTAGTKAMTGWLIAGSGSVQATASIRITAGALHHINISPPSATITVTGSCSLSAVGYDEFNNEVAITGRWELANNLGTLSETVATRTTFTAGIKVGQETLRYISSGVIGQAGITLKPLPLERFAFAPIWLSPKAGEEFTIGITAFDRYDNWVDEFNELGELTDLTKTISPATARFDCGVWTGSVTLKKATESTVIFIASQGKKGTSNSFRVLPGDVAGFEFGTIATQLVRQPFGISIQALDEFGNKADYNGTVSLTDTTDSIKTTVQFQRGILTATVTIAKAMLDVVITAVNSVATQKSQPFFVLIDHTRDEKIGIPQKVELRLGAYFLPADFYPVIVAEPHETQINIACFYHDQCLTTKRLPGSIYRIDAFDEQENQLTDGYGTGSSALIDISYDEQALASIKEDTLRVYKLENSRWLEIPDSVVDVIGNVVRAGIDELGVFMLSGAITPQDLSILVVYPNPFKPTRGDKVITFEGLPANSRIRIYDISGQLIEKAENQQAVWQWDVQDKYGQKVDSGIYIYIVTTEETEERLKRVGKIAVIR